MEAIKKIESEIKAVRAAKGDKVIIRLAFKGKGKMGRIFEFSIHPESGNLTKRGKFNAWWNRVLAPLIDMNFFDKIEILDVTSNHPGYFDNV